MTEKSLIRVAMIIQSYHPIIGGAERQLASLAPLLQSRGVELSILTRRYPGLAPMENINHIPVYRLPIPGPKPVASFVFTFKALLLLKKLRPDLIHAHELLSPTTTAILGKMLWRTPAVASILGGGKRGDLSKVMHGKAGGVRSSVIAHRVDAFIVKSYEIDSELASIGVPAERRHHIPNGVDANTFCPPFPSLKRALRMELGLPEGPVVVFTGRLEPEKQVDHLIRIWPQVKECYPDATLVLVGNGSQLQSLKQQATKGIYFAGGVENVLPYLQCADVFVLPSAREGLSNSLLEAMATSLPVVATSVGGTVDIIEDGMDGFLVGPNDIKKLQSTLIMVLGNQEAREKVGKAAREKIEDHYALTAVADRLRGLYDNLLSSANPMRGVAIRN